jgi:Ran-binding protein 1
MSSASTAAAATSGEGGEHVDTARLLLPDDKLRKAAFVKVETTGEEDETTICEFRCRLRIFIEKDEYGDEVREKFWREKGTGNMKLLRDGTTGIVRFVMRQENTFKVCSNFNIPADFTMRPPGDGPADAPTKRLLFSAPDFREGKTVADHATFAISLRSTDDAALLKKEMEAASVANAAIAAAGDDSSAAAAGDDDVDAAAAALEKVKVTEE